MIIKSQQRINVTKEVSLLVLYYLLHLQQTRISNKLYLIAHQ